MEPPRSPFIHFLKSILGDKGSEVAYVDNLDKWKGQLSKKRQGHSLTSPSLHWLSSIRAEESTSGCGIPFHGLVAGGSIRITWDLLHYIASWDPLLKFWLSKAEEEPWNLNCCKHPRWFRHLTQSGRVVVKTTTVNLGHGLDAREPTKIT